MTSAEMESATIRAFVLKEKQERFLAFIASPKHRRKFTRELAHFRGFDPRFASAVAWKPSAELGSQQRHDSGIANLVRLLKSHGAEERCWVISEDARLDGREMGLAEALEGVVGRGMGSMLCCVAGKLAYYEGEDELLMLVR